MKLKSLMKRTQWNPSPKRYLSKETIWI